MPLMTGLSASSWSASSKAAALLVPRAFLLDNPNDTELMKGFYSCEASHKSVHAG